MIVRGGFFPIGTSKLLGKERKSERKKNVLRLSLWQGVLKLRTALNQLELKKVLILKMTFKKTFDYKNKVFISQFALKLWALL